MKIKLINNILLILFLSFSLYAQTSYSQAQLRQKIDATYNEYMYLLSQYGFYDSRTMDKLEEYKKLKAIYEGKTAKQNIPSTLKIKMKSGKKPGFLSKLLHNAKLSYYKTKAISLSKKIDEAAMKGEDTRELEKKLDEIYQKIYTLENNSSSNVIYTPQGNTSYSGNSSFNNTSNGNIPQTKISNTNVNITNNNNSNKNNSSNSTKYTNNKFVDYKRLKKMSFYLSKSPSLLDKYDAELILLQFLNFKKFRSRATLIADFQKANGLSATGRLDLRTKEMLLKHLKQIKEAEERWGSLNELSKKTLPYQKMLKDASSNISYLPSGIKTRNGSNLTREKLLDALIWAESSGIHRKKSGFNVSKYSQGNCGAIGFTQLMPFTARSLGVNPYDPEDNMRGGARYLNKNLKKFSSLPYSKMDILTKSIAAYNCGPNRSAFRKYSWEQIVKYRKIPRESLIYAIKIKSKLNLPLSRTEIKYMVNQGYKTTLIRNGYGDDLRRNGYL